MDSFLIIEKMAAEGIRLEYEIKGLKKDVEHKLAVIELVKARRERLRKSSDYKSARIGEMREEIERLKGEVKRQEGYTSHARQVADEARRRIGNIYEPCKNEPSLNNAIHTINGYIDELKTTIKERTTEATSYRDLYDELFHAIIRMSSERTCASPTENPTHGQVLEAIENQMKDYCTLDDNERALNDRIKFAGFKKGNIMSAVNELISARTSLGLDVKKLKKEVIDGQGYSQHWRNKYNRLYRIAYKMRLSTCSEMLQKNKENEQALRENEAKYAKKVK